jgi:hypothetical protein
MASLSMLNHLVAVEYSNSSKNHLLQKIANHAMKFARKSSNDDEFGKQLYGPLFLCFALKLFLFLLAGINAAFEIRCVCV